jgi:hypothetical protein
LSILYAYTDDEVFAHVEGDVGVLLQLGVLAAPGVEVPVHHDQRVAGGVREELGAVVAEPDVRVVVDVELDAADVDAGVREQPPHARQFRAVAHR